MSEACSVLIWLEQVRAINVPGSSIETSETLLQVLSYLFGSFRWARGSKSKSDIGESSLTCKFILGYSTFQLSNTENYGFIDCSVRHSNGGPKLI
jgi:hypothetical protein